MLEHHYISLPVSYRYDLHLPEDAADKPLLLVLHGYGQDKAAALTLGRRIREDWPMAALQAPHPHHKFEGRERRGTGFGWVSDVEPAEDIANHHRFVAQVIERVHARGLCRARKAFLFGFSQSVSLNYRFAAAHPGYLHGLIAVAGATPSDWVSSSEGGGPRLELPVLHIAPTEDPAYPKERAAVFRKQLERRAKDVTWMAVSGGHRVPRVSYPAIRDWLDEWSVKG